MSAALHMCDGHTRLPALVGLLGIPTFPWQMQSRGSSCSMGVPHGSAPKWAVSLRPDTIVLALRTLQQVAAWQAQCSARRSARRGHQK